jgi:hypothetical protein
MPEAWLYGLAYVGRNSQIRLSYLAGEYRVTGWRTYFPTAFLLKTTFGGLLAISAGLLAWSLIRVPRRLVYRLAPVLTLMAVVLAAAINSRINIGLRHILPVIVGLWICAGSVVMARAGRGRTLLTGLLVAGCLAQAISSLRIMPHALTYFNPLAASAPDYWLADSNLDWGQGLPEFAGWLRANPEKRPVYLTYFGTDVPSRYGITATRFSDHLFNHEAYNLPAELGAGFYCFGPTQYRRVYSRTRGDWTEERERLYQAMLAEVAVLGRRNQKEGAGLLASEQLNLLKDFDALRLARLGLYLEGRPPDIRLPGGVMIFKLDEDDLQTAFYHSLPVLLRKALERNSVQSSAATPSPAASKNT